MSGRWLSWEEVRADGSLTDLATIVEEELYEGYRELMFYIHPDYLPGRWVYMTTGPDDDYPVVLDRDAGRLHFAEMGWQSDVDSGDALDHVLVRMVSDVPFSEVPPIPRHELVQIRRSLSLLLERVDRLIGRGEDEG